MFQMSLRWKFLIYYLVFTLKWLVLISLIYQFLSFIQIILKAILVRLYYYIVKLFLQITPLILPTLHIHSLYFMEIIIKAILVRLYYIVILFLVFAIQHLPFTLPWVTSTNLGKVTVFV